MTPFTVVAVADNRTIFATVRPRLGVAADRNLFYVTGGAAFTKASYTQTYVDGFAPPGVGSATGSKSLVGWTAGAGWEYAWTDHWTFRFEYLFTSFPDHQRVRRNHRRRRRQQSAAGLGGPRHPDRPRRRELQILTSRARHACDRVTPSSLLSYARGAPSGCVAARQPNR